jgi:hypothetical protein
MFSAFLLYIARNEADGGHIAKHQAASAFPLNLKKSNFQKNKSWSSRHESSRVKAPAIGRNCGRLWQLSEGCGVAEIATVDTQPINSPD